MEWLKAWFSLLPEWLHFSWFPTFFDLQKIGFGLLVGFPILGTLLTLVVLSTSRLTRSSALADRNLLQQERVQTLRRKVNVVGDKVQIKIKKRPSWYRKFEKMVIESGNLYGLNAWEWFVIIALLGITTYLVVILGNVVRWLSIGNAYFSFENLLLIPAITVGAPFALIYSKAKRRRGILQYDFIRAFQRIGDLEGHTPYDRIEIALAGTRLLKQYTPNKNAFIDNPRKALDRFVSDVGTDEAILFSSTMLYIINHPEESEGQILRTEMGIQRFRESEERKGIKLLETGFSVFIYGPFFGAVAALVLPWYQFLKRSLASIIGL